MTLTAKENYLKVKNQYQHKATKEINMNLQFHQFYLIH
ncbi:hypothetical protein SAMN05444380_10224 [Thermophagus xiamenensis]|uniref:Uncharacterized protein n=1 Tax=Thermophagus xiamenensis TaxID=385682 RepID=A0A1I1V3K5_9BACT|nr:hypothetical protein SAMN05444380_10224 [Thermophagus xiamenensis]